MTEKASKPVVVGVDGSASSTQAVRWAAQEAVRRDVPLVLLSVWTPIPAAVPHAPALSPYENELIKEGHLWLEAAVATAEEAAPGVRTTMLQATGSPAARHVPLVAVHAWSDLPVPNGWELELGPWPEIEQQQAELLEANLADFEARYPDVEVKQALVRDAPTRALLEEAASAQLVVAGSRGRGGFRGLLLGSTSQALIYHSPCPVAVVPPPRG